MTFKCCQNCIIDMICTDPCERFEIGKLHLDNLSNFNNCLRLMKKYDNKKFRNDGVSIKIGFNSIVICKNGVLHRHDGPAIIYSNGSKEWYKYGKRHRDDGPAVIDSDGYQVWYKNGLRHREDGPAIIRSDGYKAWYKNGVRIKNDIQML